jgi:hypothetical protein
MNRTKLVLLSALLIYVIGLSYVVTMTVFQEQRVTKANELKRDILEELSINNRTIVALNDDDFNERLQTTSVNIPNASFHGIPIAVLVSTEDLSYSLLLWCVKTEGQTVYYTDSRYELFFIRDYTRFVFNVWCYRGN